MESHQYQRHKEVKQMLRDDIENIIGYRFKDVSLLTTALTHSSYANDFLGDPAKGNERLEFLGDAILDAVVGYELFRRFPDYNEGSLTKLRAEIVCESALSAAAVSAGLNRFLLLGKGEEQKGGRNRPSLVADAAEAFIAAVFLDGGIGSAAQVIDRLLGDTIQAAVKGDLPSDYKTDLQVFCQKNGKTDIKYEIIDSHGPDHAKIFTAAVSIDGKRMGTGSGHTKKQAQAQAAKDALKALEENSAF